MMRYVLALIAISLAVSCRKDPAPVPEPEPVRTPRTVIAYLCGDNNLSDGFVEVYPEGLSMLMQPEPDLTGFARSYFRIWNAKSGAYRSATVSVINTDDMDELAKAIRGIRPTAANVNLSSLQHFDRYPYHLFFDLSDAVEKTVSQQQKELFDAALDKVIEYQAATPLFMSGESYSFSIRRHCELTTYIEQAAFPKLNQYYATLKWYKRLRAARRTINTG